jgi:hypothetical protein
MPDRRTEFNERKGAAPLTAEASASRIPRGPGTLVHPRSDSQPILAAGVIDPRRPAAKFGAAVDGWDAYNSWLDRIRQPTPPSRQAVIAKSLYSVSSYKSWADKARGAFDPALPVGGKAK